MITLKDFVETINYRITGGSEFQWRCFGDNARYMDCDSDPINAYSVNCIFDSVDQTVYAVEAWDYINDRIYRWIHPGYIKDYKKACKKKNIDFNEASDERTYIDIEVAEEILEKARAIINQEEYDTRIQVPLTLDNDQLFELMKLAHERDITLNQMVETVLREVIDKQEV